MASNAQLGRRAAPEATSARQEADVRLTLPARPENVAVIRHVLGAFADAMCLPPAMIEDVRLAVTEACTNVVRHAYAPGEAGAVEVLIRPAGEALHVEVVDRGRGIAASRDTAGPGLGLPLIAAVADEVEIEQTVGAGSRVAMSFTPRAA
jgi:anti-sigma regulatory factor (Ser/Thr protein kinase)